MIWIMMTVSKNIRARGNVKAAAPARAVTLLVAVAASTVVFRATLGAVPSAPANLTAQVVLNSVSLTWTPASGEVLAYRLEAGSASGLSDIASTLLAPIPSLAVSGVPDGRYFVRVRAVGGDGESDPSNEVIVLASSTGCTAVPGAPVGLTASTTGGVVTLAWQSGGGCPASTFTVVVGSSPGASDLAVASVGSARSLTASAPPGTYYVRAYAQNAFGSSGPSNEVIVRVTGFPSDICRQVSAVLTPAPYGDPDKALLTARYPSTLSGRAFFDFTSYRRGSGGTWIEYDWWRQEGVFPNGSSSVSVFIDKPSSGWRLEFKCDGALIAAL